MLALARRAVALTATPVRVPAAMTAARAAQALVTAMTALLVQTTAAHVVSGLLVKAETTVDLAPMTADLAQTMDVATGHLVQTTVADAQALVTAMTALLVQTTAALDVSGLLVKAVQTADLAPTTVDLAVSGLLARTLTGVRVVHATTISVATAIRAQALETAMTVAHAASSAIVHASAVRMTVVQTVQIA